MSVYRVRKKDGSLSPYWHYDFTVNDIRFRRSTKKKTRREAEIVERRELKRIESGETEKESLLLSEAFERYYQEHAQYLPSGADTDAQLERLLNGLGNQPMTLYTDDDIAQYVARRRADKRRYSKEQLVSNATVNRETELLRRVFRRAAKNWKKAVADIDWSLHLLPEPQERSREASAQEETDLLSNLRPDMVPLVRFCMITGTRLMSAIRLTWRGVDYHAGQITLQDKGNARMQGDRTRLVPITNELRALLAGEKGKHPINVFTYQCKRSRGKRRKGQYYPYSKDGWRKSWKAALGDAKIDDFRFHDTRHTAGSRITRKSDISVAQKLLGHTDITTTKRYAHVKLEDVRAAMDAVARQTDAKPADTGQANELMEQVKTA